MAEDGKSIVGGGPLWWWWWWWWQLDSHFQGIRRDKASGVEMPNAGRATDWWLVN